MLFGISVNLVFLVFIPCRMILVSMTKFNQKDATDYVREVAETLGVTVSDLSPLVGVSQPTITRGLDEKNPKYRITEKTIRKIHARTGIPFKGFQVAGNGSVTGKPTPPAKRHRLLGELDVEILKTCFVPIVKKHGNAKALKRASDPEKLAQMAGQWNDQASALINYETPKSEATNYLTEFLVVAVAAALGETSARFEFLAWKESATNAANYAYDLMADQQPPEKTRKSG